MRKILFIFLSSLCFPFNAWGQIDLKKPFTDRNVQGSITLLDYKNQKWIKSDSVDAETETVPASTFKIINLLIALETGVISSEMDTFRWGREIDNMLKFTK